jgi:hypothetical protein
MGPSSVKVVAQVPWNLCGNGTCLPWNIAFWPWKHMCEPNRCRPSPRRLPSQMVCNPFPLPARYDYMS